jgi:hypothetical protein
MSLILNLKLRKNNNLNNNNPGFKRFYKRLVNFSGDLSGFCWELGHIQKKIKYTLKMTSNGGDNLTKIDLIKGLTRQGSRTLFY